MPAKAGDKPKRVLQLLRAHLQRFVIVTTECKKRCPLVLVGLRQRSASERVAHRLLKSTPV